MAPSTQPQRSEWTLRVYAEDAEIEAGKPTSCVLYFRNNTESDRDVNNRMIVRPLVYQADGSTRAAQLERPLHAATLPTSWPTQERPKRYLVLTILGAHREPVRAMPMISDSGIIADLPVAAGQFRLYLKSLARDWFESGGYDLQLILYEDDTPIARSEVKRIAVRANPR